MSDPVKEAVERLSRINAESRDYTVTVHDAYAYEPVGQFWIDRDLILSELSRLSKLVEGAGEALEPFADFSERTKDMGGNFPKAGPFYTLMSSRGPVELSIEHFRRASLTHKTIKGNGDV